MASLASRLLVAVTVAAPVGCHRQGGGGTELVAPSRAEEGGSDAGPTTVDAPRPDYRADFEFLCETVGVRYIYLDDKVAHWERCRTEYADRIDEQTDREAFVGLAEQLLAELYDDHIGLRTHAQGSPLLVPTHADVWVEIVGGAPTITSVRGGSPAAEAGVVAGSELVSIEGRPVEQVLASVPRRLEPRDPEAAQAYDLRVALAGHRGRSERTFEVVTPQGRRRTFRLPTLLDAPAPTELLASRRIDGRWGYIRVHNALGDTGLIAAFDDALDSMLEADGLILDLRGTPSGGGSAIAEPMMARFVEREVAYQKMRWLAGHGESDFDHMTVAHIVPRTDRPRYTGPLVVLVSRWTGSMGEGIAVGLDGAGRATVVGTEMAHLGGAVDVFTMPSSGIGFQFPVRQLDHVDGTPRQEFVPEVHVDVAEATSEDPILEAGIGVLSAQPSTAEPRDQPRPRPTKIRPTRPEALP